MITPGMHAEGPVFYIHVLGERQAIDLGIGEIRSYQLLNQTVYVEGVEGSAIITGIDDVKTIAVHKRQDKAKLSPQIENHFSYHAPKPGQPETYQEIRDKAKEFAYLIDFLVPNSREKALAMTNLEQAVFWANAGIARN